MSANDAKNLAELKKDIEERILKAERELNLLKLSLKVVNEALTAVSFQPASKLIEHPEIELSKAVQEQKVVAQRIPTEAKHLKEVAPPTPMSAPVDEQPFPIKSKTGEDLGTMYIGKNYIRIIPNSDLIFSVRTPPFQSFFVDRVIGEMRRKDEMAADAGAKDPSSMIEHHIKLDGDNLKEIMVRNIDEDARVRELRSSIRWTLERMLEKTLKP